MIWNQNLTKEFRIIINYSEDSSYNFKRKSFHLQNHKSLLNALQMIPKNFIITTKNGSSKFNIDILKFASPVILKYAQNNSEKSEYHLEFDDKLNVLNKLEQIYQGNPVIIEKDEIQLFQEITGKLGITLNNCSNSYLGSNKYIQNKPTKAIIDLGSLTNLLKSNTAFTIKTKRKEYKCNHIGINLSTKIREFLTSNPTADTYSYDFQDEFDEFQLICDFFNFKTFSITTDNMDSIRKIAEELQINFLLNETGDFFDKYDKFYEIIDEQQESIDEINELLDLLINIEYKTVKFVKESIFQSKWSEKEEDVRELGAFILQVIDSNMILHQYLLDLLIQLNSESSEQSKLKILLPLIVDNLMDSFGTNIQNCSFVYLLYKKEIISKQELFKSLNTKLYSSKIDVDILHKMNDTNENNNPNINDGPLFNISFGINKKSKTNNIRLIKVNTPILLWFLPEIIEIKDLKNANKLKGYGTVVDSFIIKYFDQIDLYKKIRDNGEPNDDLTMALRHDDVDKFQSIISVGHINIENGIVPYNIYEEFVPNGKTKYLNYAAAYGSIKCFKYLLLNHIQVDKQTFKFAVYGGNIEIIKIVDQKYQDEDILNKNDDDDYRQRNNRTRTYQSYNKCLFARTQSYYYNDKNIISEFINQVVLDKCFTYSIVPSIVRYQNDLFDWVLEKNMEMKSIDKSSFIDLIIISYECGNVHSLFQLFDRYFEYFKDIVAVNEKEKPIISDMIQTICQKGYYILTKILLKAFESILPDDQQDILIPAFNIQKTYYYYSWNLNDNHLIYLDSLYLYDPLRKYPLRKKYEDISVISFGNLSILKLFISKYDQNTLKNILLYAITYNYINVVTYFFDNLVKKNVLKMTKDDYEYFISYSLLQKSVFLFNYLIEKIKEIDSSFVVKWSISLVINATHSNNIQLSKYISDIVFKENPKEDFFMPFMNAMTLNSVELCKYFIDQKFFISFKKLKNHIIAISKANKEIFSILMNVIPQEKMKKINEFVYINAIMDNNVDAVEIILKTMPNINHGLFEAIEISNIEIVKLILKKNSSPKFVNKRTPEGSPLNFAVRNNNLEIVKELLSVPGIDANLYDESGNTPLIKAFNNKNIDILNAILDFFGNDIQYQSWQLDILVQQISQNMNNESYQNVIDRILKIKGICMHPVNEINDYRNNSLLKIACVKNDVNFVSKLLSLDKIDVNIYEPETGNTILIEAIQNKNIEIANLLIKYPKTNINFINNNDQTPLTIAVQNNLISIIELLLNDEKFDKEDSLFNYAFSISNGEVTKILLNSKYLDINDKMYTRKNPPFTHKTTIRSRSNIYFLNDETLLINAAKNQNEYAVDLIINHPSFDKKKSKLNEAIFASFENPKNPNIFKKLIEIVDIDKFNKYQNDKKGLLNKIVGSFIWSDSNTNDKLAEFLTVALENSNLVFSELDLNDAFRSIFRNIQFKSSSDKLFTTNDLDKIIKYDKNHNNYIDINSIFIDDRTYLTSFDKENVVLLSKLLEYGADPNIPDGHGVFPLQYSFYIGNSENIRVFIKSNKIDYNKRILDIKINMDNNSFSFNSNLNKYYTTNKYMAQKQIKNHVTYLHIAARYYDPEILKIFLDNKLIDVNVTDDLGNTPLIDACRFNRGNNVELLFQIDNLDFLHCNKKGKDALHILDTSLTNDDKTVKDKNEYLKKLMTLLDKDKNNPKDKSNSSLNVWRKSPTPFFERNSSSLKASVWSRKATTSSFNQSNTPKKSWGVKSNSSSEANINTQSNPPDLIKTSDSTDKTSASKSSSSLGSKSDSSNQTNTFKSSNSLSISNQQIQLNHECLIDDKSPEKKQFSDSIDQSHESLKQVKHIDDEKFEEQSSNEVNINSQMHTKRMERSPIQPFDYESQILQEYLMTNEEQQMPQYSIDNQSLIAQQQMNQILYINQINQMQFYQQMMMQANFLHSLKHHKSKRKKKSKH